MEYDLHGIYPNGMFKNNKLGHSIRYLEIKYEEAIVIDLTGRTFGLLKVIGIDHNSKKQGIYWMCECKCQECERVPKQRSIRQDKLLEGRTLSCGCLKKKQKTRSKHLTNKFDTVSEDYGIGYTSKGEKFYFDKEDLGKITSISSSWSFNDSGYLGARDMRENAEKYSNGRRKFVYMKDIIMNKVDGEVVKYIDKNNKNDNRKTNLKKENI